jgi:hypothetical protein
MLLSIHGMYRRLASVAISEGFGLEEGMTSRKRVRIERFAHEIEGEKMTTRTQVLEQKHPLR